MVDNLVSIAHKKLGMVSSYFWAAIVNIWDQLRGLDLKSGIGGEC